MSVCNPRGSSFIRDTTWQPLRLPPRPLTGVRAYRQPVLLKGRSQGGLLRGWFVGNQGTATAMVQLCRLLVCPIVNFPFPTTNSNFLRFRNAADTCRLMRSAPSGPAINLQKFIERFANLGNPERTLTLVKPPTTRPVLELLKSSMLEYPPPFRAGICRTGHVHR